ncbi:Protein SRG1 [Acorus gramineus]|uniref:Protein SRG1 n=1 Tax=Acorus gramineus TaxID=55184 RepID=A0AAV9AKK1_ACOGR|nr:Protein SRG1 [Acorus gramineus]
MVKSDPSNVPEKYIRSSEERPDDANISPLSSQIPVIDMSLLSIGNKDELNKLDFACKEWGFFQIINHGVTEELLQKTKEAANGFFELPLEEKNKYDMSPDDIQGYGHAYVVSEEQKLDWSDILALLIYPERFRKPKFWPTTSANFKMIIEAYSAEVGRVGEELLAAVSLLMGMERGGMISHHKEVMQALRVNYYPPCSRPDQVIGLSPHSDTSSLTILLQDFHVTGLQIRHATGWVPVKPVPNALVVNVGDVIEILSNGKYKSIEHRAVTNATKARISFASFICPADNVEIGPLDQMVDGHEDLKIYRKLRYGDYLRSSMKREHQGKAHIEFAKLKDENE